MTDAVTTIVDVNTTDDDVRLYRRNFRQIKLADDVLVPRREFARDELHVSDKTASRMNLPTVYVGGAAHIARNAAMRIISENIGRRNQAPRRRARRA